MTLYFGSQEFVCESAEEAQMYLDKIVGFVQNQMGFRAFDDNGTEMCKYNLSENYNNMTAMVMGMKELIAKAKQEKKKKDK